MGNFKSKQVYVAKETYTPMVRADSSVEEGADEEDQRKLELLAIHLDDELVLRETGDGKEASTKEIKLQNYGETFLFMKNRRTKEKGYVCSHYVAQKGSIEAFQ